MRRNSVVPDRCLILVLQKARWGERSGLYGAAGAARNNETRVREMRRMIGGGWRGPMGGQKSEGGRRKAPKGGQKEVRRWS
ncbi:hypothetical protein DQG13_21805 [Paenibacillus sp. YN15]|nr:hypothetical protein DQG13_21805 [Paenibacillus sp. YN15]